MRILRSTLILIGVFQVILGSIFLLIPAQFSSMFNLEQAPAWVYWLFAMMGARFLGFAVGMFFAARNPYEHRYWIAIMVGVQALDWFGTIFYLLTGAVSLATVTTAAFLPILFVIVLVTQFPRSTSRLQSPAT
jgi:hypothetical protein